MKLKGAGFIPFCAVLIFLSSALGEKLVEVSTAITKLRFLPSASSETRGFARKGQRFVVDGESGQWFRIRLYNSTVWIAKDAVSVLESSEPPPAVPETPATVGTTTPATTAAAMPAQPGSQVPHTPRPPAAGTPSAATSRPSPGSPGQTASPTTPGQLAPATAETSPTLAALPESARAAIAATQTLSQGQAPPAETAAATPAAAPARPPRPVQVVEAAPQKPKKPFRPRSTWFSQFSRMPQVPSGVEGQEIAFFQVVNKDAVVLYMPLDGGPVLARIKKGDYFPVLDSTEKWLRIAYADTAGWVERDKGAITTTPSSGIIDEQLLILIIAAVLIIGAIAMVIVLFMRRMNKNKTKQTEPLRALIIARSSPDIQAIISNKIISLEKYLVAIGFSVKILHHPEGGQHFIEKFQPDVVFIDWNISSDIPGTVEILFAGFEQKKLPLAIFYNVPDPSAIPLIPVLLRAYHLGVQFSDHDISKLITPTMLSRSSTKAPAASALEGDIAEGNLPEILQFIEIGKKNGCLLVETDSPVGMIYFGQGRIVHAAAANGLAGRDAINVLLALKQGHFRFLLNKQPKTSDLNLSTLEVLMEWTKTVDEAHRD